MSADPSTLGVVMPTRNQAAFIEASVRSVLSQPQVRRLVVQDGGSTDGTQDRLSALSREYEGRLDWRSEPDSGPADALNRAVARCDEPILGWLNSDDLYTPGAAARALAAFAAQPSLVLVYGEGEHVDEDGHSLGRYPTQGPEAPLAHWADGCPVCQPTAFFRRDMFVALGGLDTRLRTAFDFEFWLRAWRAHPGRIGFVPQVQALSRLHEAGITLRMREQVAMECLEVIHRHIGPAPVHWLLTHATEALARCPFEESPDQVRAHLQALLVRASGWLAPGAAAEFARHLAQHRGWQLARSDVVADVHADGWAPPSLAVRLRQPAAGEPAYRRLRLWGRNASPRRTPLRLKWLSEDGQVLWEGSAPATGGFQTVLPVPESPGALKLTLRSEPGFVPAEVDARSADRRHLAFMLDAVELLR